jgi:hypothetical protein
MPTNLPIGSIVASILTLHDFQTQVGHGETWAQADGTKVADGALKRAIENGGAEYAGLNPGNVPTLPNLNGVFLRGRDYATTPAGLRNPDGKTLVGTFQADGIASHVHSVHNPASIGGDRTSRGDAWYGDGGNATGANQNATGDTRPRNVTVNYFIRTN